MMVLALLGAALAADFSYTPPGQLQNNGVGRADQTVYVPGMRFPLESGPAYLNSQIYGHGGYLGPGGGQCDAENYSYPWFDDFCEARSWEVQLCPSGKGHQGQDIRPATCEKDKNWAVAAEDGTISAIGEYSVSLVTANGTRHRYLHLEPSSLAVHAGDHVTRGQRIGRVSNAFGGAATTIHLHYDIVMPVSGVGSVYVPPYMSLVRSYEELTGTPALPCDPLPATGGTLDDAGPCLSRFGNPSYWRKVTGEGNGGSLQWTNAWDGPGPSNHARFKLRFAAAGTYRLSVNTVPAYAMSQQARYVVRHDGVEETVPVNLTTATNGWVTLGEFNFAAGEVEQWVGVTDNTGEATSLGRRIMIDALKVEPVAPVLASGSSGGGSSGGGSSSGGAVSSASSGGSSSGGSTVPTSPTGKTSAKGGCCSTSSQGPSGLSALSVAALALYARRRRDLSA